MTPNAILAASMLLATAASAQYRLDQPDSKFVLASALDEISGLSSTKDDGHLWALHDEKGVLFKLSTKDGSIQQEVAFGPAGDYEGVEEVDGKVYVVRSDGVVFAVDPKSAKTTKHDFSAAVGAKCNVEGLGHESKRNRLLLACKGATKDSKKSGQPSFDIFAVDLKSMTVAPKPAFVLNAQPTRSASGKKVRGYAPSGLAVHPQTGEIHVLSSAGKVLVVLDPETGALVRVDPLDPSMHAQPEGITFGADGTMFLSNEAAGGKPMLYAFKKS